MSLSCLKNEEKQTIFANKSPSTRAIYSISYRQFEDFCSKNHIKKEEITQKDIDNYIEYMSNTLKLKHNTIKIKLNAIKSYYKDNKITLNAKTPTLYAASYEPNILSLQMINQLYLRLKHNPRKLFMFVLFSFCEGRSDTIASLDVTNIDIKKMVVIYKNKKRKSFKHFSGIANNYMEYRNSLQLDTNALFLSQTYLERLNGRSVRRILSFELGIIDKEKNIRDLRITCQKIEKNKNEQNNLFYSKKVI